MIAGEGDVHRRDAATGAVRSFAHENFFYTGLVEEHAVVLAHAGEPLFVKRWKPAKPAPAPPLLPGEPTSTWVTRPPARGLQGRLGRGRRLARFRGGE